MKINKEHLPVIVNNNGTVLRSQQGFGELTATYNELPAGTNFAPLLKGLENDHCHCSHYGTVLQGAIRISYDDGTEEVIRGGDLFYIPAGHRVLVEEDLKIVLFSAIKEHSEVMNHVVKQMAHS